MGGGSGGRLAVRRGGKSELQRAGCWVTPRGVRRNPGTTDRATETRPPMAPLLGDQARVKRWGKSPPDPRVTWDAGNPHPEQGQTGRKGEWPAPKTPG